MAEFYTRNLVSPEGQVVEAKTPDELQRYAFMGYKEASVAEIKRDEVHKVYNSWAGKAASFGDGILNGIPFLQAGILGATAKLGSNQAAQSYAEQSSNFQESNPISSGIGQAFGTLGTALVGGEAATIAGAPAAVTAPAVLSEMAVAASTNAAIGVGQNVNRAAIAHAFDPAGEERILAHIGTDAIFDGVLGAAFPLAGKALSKMAGKIGDMADWAANKEWRKSLIDSENLKAAIQQGRATQLGQTLDEHALWGDTPADVLAKINPKIDALGEEYNQMKSNLQGFRMDASLGGKLVDELGSALHDSHPELAQKLVNKMNEYGFSPNVGELHQLRQMVDSKINFSHLTEDELAKQVPLMNAREDVSRYLRQHLNTVDVASGGSAAEAWKTLDKDYGNLLLLKGALKSGKETATKETLPWWLGLVAHGMGLHGVSSLFYMYKGAAAMKTMFENGQFAKPAKALAGIFNNASEKLTDATMGGLLGAAAETSSVMHAAKYSEDEFSIKSAQIRHGVEDPSRAVGNMANHMTQAGIPEEMATSLAMRASAMQLALHDALPKNPNPTLQSGTPSTFLPSIEFRRNWMDLYNTLHDPTYGILNPTKQNMAAIQKFYPETLAQVQQAIRGQMVNNTEIPLEAQTWASRVMGYPVGPLTSPLFYTQLTTARQQQAAQAQVNKQKGQTPKQAQDMIDSNLTKTQSLQNRKQ